MKRTIKDTSFTFEADSIEGKPGWVAHLNVTVFYYTDSWGDHRIIDYTILNTDKNDQEIAKKTLRKCEQYRLCDKAKEQIALTEDKPFQNRYDDEFFEYASNMSRSLNKSRL